MRKPNTARPSLSLLWRGLILTLPVVFLTGCAQSKKIGSILGFVSGDAPVTASSEQLPFSPVTNLFDENATRHWMTKRFPFFPEWIEFSYSEPFSMGEFGYVGLVWRVNSTPKKFTLLAWLNDAWKPVLRVTDGCITQKNAVRSWILPEAAVSTRFRMQIDSNCGDNEYVGLQKIRVDRYYQYARLEELSSKKHHQVFPTVPATGKVVGSTTIHESNGVKNLFDDIPASIWHREVANLKNDRKSWLTIELADAPAAPVVALGISPNPAQPMQFFDMAIIQGSPEGTGWQDIAKIRLTEPPKDGGRLFWTFKNPTAFRHYRLLIPSGFAGGDFYSMSGLEMYAAGLDPEVRYKAERTAEKNKPADRVFPRRGNLNFAHASSYQHATASTDQLFDGNRETYWHADAKKVENGEIQWVIVDVGEKKSPPVRIVRAWPRADATIQFIKSAIFEGSDDAGDWTMIGKLDLPKLPPDGGEIAWRVNNDQSFRYYRLTVPAGHAGGQFLSIAELELHTR